MAEITVEELTTQDLDGTGVFDELMQAVQLRLDSEFNQNRINGADYSKVFLGALDSTMQQSLAFVLGRQQADKQAALLDAQARKTEVEILNEEINTALLNKQLLKLDAEIALLIEQLNYLVKQGVKIEQDGALVEQNTTNATATYDVLLKQKEKLTTEIALLEQKTKTEVAQIRDIVDGEAVTGVIGKENALRNQQTEGFKRDAEQKLLKIFTDTWTVRQTTDGALTEPAGLSDSDINSVSVKAREGIQA